MALTLLTTRAEIRAWRQGLRARHQRLGLVPTMGALHAGHLSLVEEARRHVDSTAVTIFVNPTQFSPSEDFTRYPRTLEADLKQLDSIGVDSVIVPSVEEIYPSENGCLVTPGAISLPWEGALRPGHFPGVATVVLKLFSLLEPDVAVFGEKDFQQLLVIRHMVRDLLLPVKIVACPTMREPDGLAMSSRNRYLAPEERTQATSIYQTLVGVTAAVQKGERDAAALRQWMGDKLSAARLNVDYATIVDTESLLELNKIDRPAIAIIAARLGTTRLIDNMRLNPKA